MRLLLFLVLAFFVSLSYGQADDQFLITGNANTEGCSGVATPIFIKNLYTSIGIKVKYKRIESNKTDLVSTTPVLGPGQQIRIGCATNEGGFVRKFEVISIEKGVSVSDDITEENKNQILNGTKFKVILNGSGCPSDSGYTGKGDPLGTLLCGKTYTGVYANNAYTITGFHERNRKNETHTYSNASPNNYQISLWGVRVQFNEENEIGHHAYGLIGTLSFD